MSGWRNTMEELIQKIKNGEELHASDFIDKVKLEYFDLNDLYDCEDYSDETIVRTYLEDMVIGLVKDGYVSNELLLEVLRKV